MAWQRCWGTKLNSGCRKKKVALTSMGVTVE